MLLRTTLMAGLLAGTVLVAPAPADARTTVTVTSSTRLVGHGFGHGRGMSQYGAYGAALRGVKSRDILRYYYPGTTPAKLRSEVRVLIGADNDDDTVVRPTAGLAIADYGAGRAYVLPENGARLWKMFTSYGVTKVSYLSATGGWKRYALGGKSALAGVGEFRSKSGKLTLRTPQGDRRYRGGLRYVYQNTVNRLSLETYLRGVLPTEMPTGWRMAALEAQAVAARSYAAREIVDNRNRSYHVYDDTRSQVYGGIGAEDTRATTAITATAGTVLMYDGKPALTQFSSSNGGWTTAGATQAYLVAKADKFEQYSGNPNADWSVAIDAAALERRYPEIGDLEKFEITERDGNGEWGGRVTGVRLIGSAGTKEFGTAAELPGTSELRSVLGLRSTYFTVVP